MKITFHTRDPMEFSYDVAFEIVKSLGGELDSTAKKVAASFDYIFHFIQLKNKSQKRLKGIYEVSVDKHSHEIAMKEICRYDHQNDRWKWKFSVSEDKIQAGGEEDAESLKVFLSELKSLSAQERQVTGDRRVNHIV